MTSSKYAIHPAPRKRPWICKASPPALPVPPAPPSLYATLYLADDLPGNPPPFFNRTLLLKPFASPQRFQDTWSDGGDFLTLTFFWTLGQATAYAELGWSIGPHTDTATAPTLKVQQWPKLSYAAFDLTPAVGQYRTRLLITN